jgi:L,D-transpeptidase catalytic domain.
MTSPELPYKSFIIQQYSALAGRSILLAHSLLRGCSMKKLLFPLLLASLSVGAASATEQKPSPLSDLPAAIASLKPGQYLWYPEISPTGPVTLVVSLTEQRLYAYRNGIAIGVATVSTGRKGKETPTGVFTILQKQVDHHSTLYNDASMPYMERLTWDGVALHAGGPCRGIPPPTAACTSRWTSPRSCSPSPARPLPR